MTIKTRNLLLLSILILSLLPLFIYIFTVSYILHNPTFFNTIEISDRPLNFIMVSSGLLILYAAASGCLTYFYFRRTASTEVFFFLCFLATIMFEAYKPFAAFMTVSGEPSYYILLVSKAIYFAYILGTAFLFSGAFFSTIVDYKRYELIFAFAIITILYMIMKIPFYSMQEISNIFTYEPSLKMQITAGSILTLVSTAIIYIYTGIKDSSKDMILAGTGFILLTTARELIAILPYYNNSNIYVIFGTLFAILVGGTYLFVKKIHNIYLWY